MKTNISTERSVSHIPGSFLRLLREPLLFHQLLKVDNVLQVRNEPEEQWHANISSCVCRFAVSEICTNVSYGVRTRDTWAHKLFGIFLML